MKKESCIKKLPLKHGEEYSNGNDLVKCQESNAELCVEDTSVQKPSSPSEENKSTNSDIKLEDNKNMEKTGKHNLRTKSQEKTENTIIDKNLDSNNVNPIASQGDNVSNKVEDSDSNAKNEEKLEDGDAEAKTEGSSLKPKRKKAPKKTNDVTYRCDICNLDLSSESTLNTHTAGSKHQKKQKSKEVLDYLTKNESGFEQDSMTGVIRCLVCDITVNSPQLLAAHVSSKRHKSKKDSNEKRKSDEEEPVPAKKIRLGVTNQANGSNNENQLPFTGSSDVYAATKSPIKEAAPVTTMNIPSYVTTFAETKNAAKFFCTPCQASCNSDVQLYQHLSSKKHLAKVPPQ